MKSNSCMRKLIFTYILLFASTLLFSQNDSIPKTKINKQYIKSYITDTRDIFISPIKWKTKQWIGFTAFTGLSYALYTQDLKIRNYVQDNKTETTDMLSENIFEPVGSGLYTMSGFALLGLHGLVFDNNRSYNTALLGVKTYLITGLVVSVPKLLINRHRPYHDDVANPSIFDGPFKGEFFRAYPSGHTTSAFAMATIIASEYNDNIIIPITVYSLASLSGLSRINDDKHWATDVLGGAVFGFAMGKLLYNNSKKANNISVYTGSNSTGLVLNYTIK